ncbi:WXG100 family type VII secretion target [Cellulomonas soli]
MTAPSEPELGTTDDATALVPGSAGDIRGVAQTLRSWATRLADTGDELRALRAPTWTGDAADAFWASFGRVPTQWFTASDLLNQAAAALDSHADVITTAQSRAQDAIDAWTHAQTLTAQSKAAHQAALAQYAQHGGVYPTYLDGGGAGRREAEEILAAARQTLDTSGEETILALTRAGGGTYSTSGSEGPGTEGAGRGAPRPATSGRTSGARTVGQGSAALPRWGWPPCSPRSTDQPGCGAPRARSPHRPVAPTGPSTATGLSPC